MTSLLVSVKDPVEAKQAAIAGADLIDLKNPNIGALGALDDRLSNQIMHELKQFNDIQVSATVGDRHDTAEVLLKLVQEKANLGVDFVKLPYSEHLFSADFQLGLQEMMSELGTKIIVVIDASETIPKDLLLNLKPLRLYGVMLDTFNKQKSLIESKNTAELASFVNECKELHFYVGLAGSLKASMVDSLIVYRPDYLGFRSGVCSGNIRENRLLSESVKAVKRLLYNHNVGCEA